MRGCGAASDRMRPWINATARHPYTRIMRTRCAMCAPMRARAGAASFPWADAPDPLTGPARPVPHPFPFHPSPCDCVAAAPQPRNNASPAPAFPCQPKYYGPLAGGILAPAPKATGILAFAAPVKIVNPGQWRQFRKTDGGWCERLATWDERQGSGAERRSRPISPLADPRTPGAYQIQKWKNFPFQFSQKNQPRSIPMNLSPFQSLALLCAGSLGVALSTLFLLGA